MSKKAQLSQSRIVYVVNVANKNMTIWHWADHLSYHLEWESVWSWVDACVYLRQRALSGFKELTVYMYFKF